jgi:hypothetical protein
VSPEAEALLQNPEDDDIPIWPDMAGAVAIFFGMTTQWRWVGAGMGGVMRTGLDYAALPAVAAGAEVTIGPEVLSDLRTMELAAMERLNRR